MHVYKLLNVNMGYKYIHSRNTQGKPKVAHEDFPNRTIFMFEILYHSQQDNFGKKKGEAMLGFNKIMTLEYYDVLHDTNTVNGLLI